MCSRRHHDRASGFTLTELLIVVAIIAVLAGIAIPHYRSGLASARISKARQELRIIANAIDLYRVRNEGRLPLYLDDVGHGGRLDPWGNPYGYINFQSGTGEGLEWAIEQGLVDPQVIASAAGKGAGKGAAKAVPSSRAVGFYRRFSLAPPGATSEQVLTEVAKVRRRDRFLFPLNTDYDLFSRGPNGATATTISSKLSLDDVIRANDGAYFGTASEY